MISLCVLLALLFALTSLPSRAGMTGADPPRPPGQERRSRAAPR